MPEKQILAKKTYVDNNLNNVVRNVNGVVSIPNTQVELSQKIVTTTEEDPDTHEEITTNEVVTESYLDKTKLHVEDSYASKTAEYGVNGIALNGSTITGITDSASGSSSTLAVSQRALSNFKQVEANPVGQATADLTTIKIDNTIYELDAGTNVSITPTITEGTKIADYSIDGVNGALYYKDSGGDEILHPIIAGSTNNTDSNGSGIIEYVYPGSETITLSNFFKNLKSYTFEGYNGYTSTTTLDSYANDAITFSWTTQSGHTKQWFDIVLVVDLSLLHELSPWTKYYGGSYTFEVPNGIDEDSIIIDFRAVKSGNSMDITNANVTKSISNNILTVTLPMHEGNTYCYIEAKIYYLKKPTKYSKVIGNPLETPTEVLNSIKIINDDIIVNNYLVNGQIATSDHVYITCNLDIPLINGDYKITIKDPTKGYEYYKTFTYAGQDITLNWTENGYNYVLLITETTVGLIDYSGNWRNMYCDIYSKYLDNKVYEIKGGDNSVELTTAAYNALPQSEKMNGTTYLLTDANPSGGGGSSIDYSTTEQDTGIRWIDGSPIYQKTIALNNTAYNGGLSGIPHNITNLGQVVSFNVNFLDTNPASDREWTKGVIQPPMQLRANATNLYFYSTYSGDTYSWDAKTSRTWYITLQYTKLS